MEDISLPTPTLPGSLSCCLSHTNKNKQISHETNSEVLTEMHSSAFDFYVERQLKLSAPLLIHYI